MGTGKIEKVGLLETIDPVTELPSSLEYVQCIKRMISNRETGVIFKLSINRFNNYNILYGFDFGDEVLRAVAKILKEYTDKKDLVFRLEGAKFSFVVLGLTEEVEVARLYDDIKSKLSESVYVHDLAVPVSINASAVIIEEDFAGDDVQIRSTLTYALAKSKDEMHGELVLTDSANNDTVDRVKLISSIHRNVLEGCSNFHMVYQPLVDPITEEIKGAEALVRYTDPVEGEIPPGRFIAWLEEDPVFYKLGHWIMRTAMTEMEPVIRKNKGFVLNINITASQFKAPSFRADVSALIKEFKFPKKTICLELTERCRQLDVDFLRTELSYFRSLGLLVSLDDFGTGSSSLSVLRDIPIDEIKIDMSFVKGIEGNRINQSLVKTIIFAAEQMELSSCIEGVENAKIADFLRGYKSTYYQGYYYSRPVDMEHFAGMIAYE